MEFGPQNYTDQALNNLKLLILYIYIFLTKSFTKTSTMEYETKQLQGTVKIGKAIFKQGITQQQVNKIAKMYKFQFQKTCSLYISFAQDYKNDQGKQMLNSLGTVLSLKIMINTALQNFVIRDIVEIHFPYLLQLRLVNSYTPDSGILDTIQLLQFIQFPSLILLVIQRNRIHSLKSLRKLRAPMLQSLNIAMNQFQQTDGLFQINSKQLRQISIGNNKSMHQTIRTVYQFLKFKNNCKVFINEPETEFIHRLLENYQRMGFSIGRLPY